MSQAVSSIADAVRRLDEIDIESLESWARALVATPGMVYVVGVGKSQTIAKHWAELFRTIGVRSFMLDPVRMLHGDLGCVGANDAVVFVSKSGKTTELAVVLEHVRRQTAHLYAVVCDAESPIARSCPRVLLLPSVAECDPIGCVPTNSFMMFVICGNLVVSCAMEELKVTAADLAASHPGGSGMRA